MAEKAVVLRLEQPSDLLGQVLPLRSNPIGHVVILNPAKDRMLDDGFHMRLKWFKTQSQSDR